MAQDYYNGSATMNGFFDIVLADPAMLTPLWVTTYINNTSQDNNYNNNGDIIQNSTLIKEKINNNGHECNIISVPTVAEYLTAVSYGGKLLLALAVSATIFILVLYADTLRHITRRTPARTKSLAACVISVYPVVAIATLCASVVPRAQLLTEALTQAAFTAAWYQFFCLILAYCGGEASLLAAKPEQLSPRVPPLCCFWVCMPHALDINKRNLRLMRLLILQLPAVQCLLYVALLVAWAEQQTLAAAQQVILVQPVMFISIFTGLWGMGMAVRMLAPRVLAGFHLREKMLVLQFVLIFSKLQGLAVRATGWAGGLPCSPPLPPAVFGNLIYNTLIMTEMVVLQLIAWRLYKRPLPKAPMPLVEENEVTIPKEGASSIPTLSSIVDEKAESRGRQ